MNPQMFDMTVFAARRQRLLHEIGDGVAVLSTAPERLRNQDSHYPYRFDSHFYYLTGFTEPEAVLVLQGSTGRALLFCREKNPEREIWDGHRYGHEAAQVVFGFDAAYPIAQLDDMMPDLLGNQPALHYAMGADTAWDSRVMRWLNAVREKSRSGVQAPTRMQDVRDAVAAMRLLKDEVELAVMQRSADIACVAHQRAMQVTRPGQYEYQIEAELLYEFRRQGAQSPAYTSIVAGGANACTLHYVDNASLLRAGDLLLIDAGCELDGYASDITRTFPVNGRFEGAQRDVYTCVLAAQLAAIEQVRPGASWQAPHDAAVRVLAQGMLDWGLLQGSLDGVIESGAYKRFYMHRTGHWLGLDVHDVGAYKHGDVWRSLEPGMVLTAEPGCYIAAADDVPQAFHHIGIRIEDDVSVTQAGCHVLTAAAPKSMADIENLMAATREGAKDARTQ
jgi:Xaa-Pro aminopeptidase